MPEPESPTYPPPTSGTSAPLVLGVAGIVTVAATALSYALPAELQALGVAAVFLGATYTMVVRSDETQRIRHHGVSLGGLVEPEPIDWQRVLRQGSRSLRWAALVALVAFPPFWVGYVHWYDLGGAFSPVGSLGLVDDALGQLLVIALPEEAFYRGYLQTALDDSWGTRVKILGARVGPGLLVASAIFALGHFATHAHPARLAVFFPALVFGWLRARTGGIGAGLVFHALCNLFADFLGQGYGLAP